MKLSIVLPLRNQAELTSLISRLYDPASPDYHQFLSVDQFTAEFSPTAEDYQAVVDFAVANGFTVTGKPENRLVVPISGSVAQVNKAFHVSMNLYRHPTENRTFFSPDREPSLAANLPVAHIAGMNNFSIPRSLATSATQAQAAVSAGSGPSGSYLASDMRAAYYGGTALTGSGQTVGLVEFDGYQISDVAASFDGTATASTNGSNYELAYTPVAGGTTYNVPINNILLDGTTGASVSGNDAEEALDIVQAIGMAPGLSQVRVYIGSSDVDILNAIASENIAQQVSISWGWSPDDPSTDDFIFQEMAAQGQSVFGASGDNGAYSSNGYTIDFAYFYPAEDAWVTAVGGTDLYTNDTDGSWYGEIAWDQSGGGISPDGIPIPSWQAGVADASNGASTTLRNVPDVAAEADTDNYSCNMGLCQGGWGGTSFAAPRWAGFTALVNQQAVAAGNPTVGFITPSIYAVGKASSYESELHDITAGNNNCCYPATSVSFDAVSGYDLVTGWGTPAGQNLINALAPPALAGFQLSASPKSLTINPGASGTTTISVQNTGGFTGSVNLSISGLPSGVTASFNPSPANGISLLTLTVGSNAIRGSYLLTISGTSGSNTSNTSLALQVNAPGFSVSSNPGSILIFAGTSGSSTILVTDYAGFTGKVSFAITSGLPSGVTATWVTDPTTGNDQLTLAVSNAAAAGNTILTITGTSGSLTATNTIALQILPPYFAITSSSLPVSIAQGGSATATITVVPFGGLNISSAGTVNLTTSGFPAGLNATFSQNPTTSGSSVLTLTADSSAPIGTYTIYIVANSPNASNKLSSEIAFQIAITATPTPSFTLGTSSSYLTVAQGNSVTNTVTMTPLLGFTGAVTLSGNRPLGTTISFNSNPVIGSSLLTLATSASTAAGIYQLTVWGTSRTQTISVTYFLTVTAPPSFTLSTASASLNAAQGASATDTLMVTPQSGFTGQVTLSAPNLPSGISASFSSNPTSGSSGLTLTASTSTLPGKYPVILVGTSGAQTVTTLLSLTVSPSPAATLTSPAPGSTLNSSSVTFTWSPGTGATEYSLCVGDLYAGNCNFYNSGILRGVYSTNVSDLPIYGEKLYVRLCSLIGSTWQCQDSTYSMSGTPILAALTSPPPGSTLTTSSATFQWTAGAGVTNYILQLGSTGKGSKNLYNGTSTTATQAAITGLPSSGVLYARLYSQFNGSWAQYVDYTYSAADTPTPAALTSPSSGSLLGSSAAFAWSTGVGVSEYSLCVGDLYSGNCNLYNSGVLKNAFSASVSSLPVYGENIYVRLCSYLSGAWQCNNTTFEESGTPVLAALTSPTPGTQLTGSSATFQWTTGGGVTNYYLQLGTTGKGSKDIYNGVSTTSTSVSVSNLPTNGKTIYARLYSQFNGSWANYTDFTYTAQ